METLLKILDATLIASLFVFTLSAIHFYAQHRKRANASINLIQEYAGMAQEYVKERVGSYKSMRKNIKDGSPHGEPANDHTPLLFYNKEYELSFEQISELLRFLRENEQKLLLKYFATQSMIDSIVYGINTDYFRTMPQN